MSEQTSTQVGRIEFEWGGQTFYFDPQHRTHQGKFPPSKFILFDGKVYDARQGYPLEILAQVVAEKPEQILAVVLSETQVLVLFAGTDKYVLLKEKEDDPEFFSRTFLRFYLESSSPTFYCIGEHPKISGAIHLSPENLELPPVISPKKSLLLIGGVFSLGLMFYVASLGFFSLHSEIGEGVESWQARVMAQIESLERKAKELERVIHDKENDLLQQRKAMEEKINPALFSQKPPLPQVIQSFTEAALPYRYSSNVQLRIEHGRFNVGQSH